MKYDFTTIMNREGKDAIAIDVIPIPDAEVKEGFSKIPMWVADMNFPTVPTIQEAVIRRMNHPSVSAVSGACTETTSDSFNNVSKSTRSYPS